MKKCNHVWINGFVDFGIGYIYDANKFEMFKTLKKRDNTNILLPLIGFKNPQYCEFCFLQKFIRYEKVHYNYYWQKELRLNREMVNAYIKQLRESDAPMNYYDFLPFWEEKSKMTGEKFQYRNRLPKEKEKTHK
jgi:hypothetical protein